MQHQASTSPNSNSSSPDVLPNCKQSEGQKPKTARTRFKSNFYAIYRTIETTKYNNDMSLLHSQTNETQHFPAVRYPSSCNTRQAEHVSSAADTRRPEKNLTNIGAGNLGRNQSRLRLPGPTTGPLTTN